MMKDAQSRFDAGARAWAEYNLRPLGRIRREVTWHNLVSHLPDVTNPDVSPCVLDAGGGAGELALRLVQLGYRVWLLDRAPAMLDLAQRAANVLPCCISPFATNDYASLILGNLLERPFAELWNGAPYRQFRTRLLSENPHQACAGCGVHWSV